MYCAILTINETAFDDTPINMSASSFQHLECLHSCLESIKSWFDIFLEIQSADYVGLSFSIISQLIHCLIALYKLSTLDDPAWDKDAVRKRIDVLSILDQFIYNITSLDGSESSASETIFSKVANKFSSIRFVWGRTLEPEMLDNSMLATGSDAEKFSFDFPLEYIDTSWLMDIAFP
jgi:hypothetical protein